MLKVKWSATVRLGGEMCVSDDITLGQLDKKLRERVTFELGWTPPEKDLQFGPIHIVEEKEE